MFQAKIDYYNNPYQAAKNADALIVLTEWNEFKQIDLAKLKKIMKSPVLFDGRNIYHPELMKKIGFMYYSVGR
jgi:UDPglucose 6-dehydrogenase